MDENAIRQLLDDVRSGSLDPDDAVARLRRLPFADIGFAKVDHHRPLRQGLLEAVYGPGKTPDQCAAIVAELLTEPAGQPVLLTRADPDQVAAALERNPGGRRTPTSAGGDQFIAFTGELRVPIARTVEVAGFYDGGNLWQAPTDILHNFVLRSAFDRSSTGLVA